MPYIKYPKTMHLPWSPSIQQNDSVITNLDAFINREIVITEKMDGENTSLYVDRFQIRDNNSCYHTAHDWMESFHESIAHHIPSGWRICGENMFAKHSIDYDNLDSFFYGFSIWNNKNVALSWDETLDWFDVLKITPVKTLYRGPFDMESIDNVINQLDPIHQEGFVMRVTGEIPFEDFNKLVAKWVHSQHT